MEKLKKLKGSYNSMSLKSRKLSEYELNGLRFVTIEVSNDNGQRVWVKAAPVKNRRTVCTANILDLPQDVNWKQKNSHFEEVNPTGRKQNYISANSCGSVCVPAGTFILSKAPDTQLFMFPLDPVNKQNSVTKMNFTNTNKSFAVIGSVDAATWIGYAASSGTVFLV